MMDRGLEKCLNIICKKMCNGGWTHPLKGQYRIMRSWGTSKPPPKHVFGSNFFVFQYFCIRFCLQLKWNKIHRLLFEHNLCSQKSTKTWKSSLDQNPGFIFSGPLRWWEIKNSRYLTFFLNIDQIWFSYQILSSISGWFRIVLIASELTGRSLSGT